MDKSDTIKIFTVECMVVSLLSFAMAFVVNIFVTSIINDFISQNVFLFDGFNILRIRFVVVLVTGIINYALSVISVLIPIRKYSKVKIIELIK